MRIDEIELRKAEIRSIVNGEAEYDVDALTEEVRALDAEKAELEARAAKEAELRNSVSQSVIAEIKEQTKKEERKMDNIITRNSPEYINAFADYIKTGNDTEVRTLLSENASGGTIAVPEIVESTVRHAWDEEGIMSLVKKSYIKGNLKIGFERSAGAASVHTEGSSAIAEEELTLGIVTLTAKSLKKWVAITDEALDLSGEAYLEYIYAEVAHQIAKKAADQLVAEIVASPTTSSATACAVPSITANSISLGTVASAIAELSDEAANPVIIMNKLTYAAFKSVQYAGNYAVDPFEGCKVLFNNTLTAFGSASATDTYAIVGDLGFGAQANFPNGEEITFKYDDISLATSDLVKVIGREFVAVGVVAPKAFCRICK